MATLRPGGDPALADSPSGRAGGTSDMKAGTPARAAACAEHSASVTAHGSAIAASALQRRPNERISAQTP